MVAGAITLARIVVPARVQIYLRALRWLFSTEIQNRTKYRKKQSPSIGNEAQSTVDHKILFVYIKGYAEEHTPPPAAIQGSPIGLKT